MSNLSNWYPIFEHVQHKWLPQTASSRNFPGSHFPISSVGPPKGSSLASSDRPTTTPHSKPALESHIFNQNPDINGIVAKSTYEFFHSIT